MACFIHTSVTTTEQQEKPQTFIFEKLKLNNLPYSFQLYIYVGN